MNPNHRLPAVLGAALALGIGAAALGQVRHDHTHAHPGPSDLPGLAQQMADQVLNLAEVMLRDLGGTREGLHLIEDTRELGLSVAEFRDVVRRSPDPYQARRAFAGIDQSWGHLSGMLRRTRMTPGIDQAAQGVAATAEQIREAIGLRAAPPVMYLQPPLPPDEITAARREAEQLHGQAADLVAAMRAELGDHPNRDHVLSDAHHLMERSETFEEFLAMNPSPERIRTAYASINDVANCLHNDLSQQPPSARIVQTFQRFVQIQQTITQRLDLPAPPPAELAQFAPQPPPPPAPPPEVIAAQREVERLHGQAADLVAAMRTELGDHPNRDHIFQDAQQLVERTETFEEFLAMNPSPEQIRASYASINDVANCLHNDLSQQPPAPAIVQAFQSFTQVQRTVHQTLNLNLPTPPPPLELAPPPAPAMVETRRVSYTMQERAESLVQAMRTSLGPHPNAQHIVQDARQLVERTEHFEQVLASNPTPEQFRAAYAPIQEVANCLHGDLTRQPAPPQVMETWTSFVQAQYLVHQTMELPPPPPSAPVALWPAEGQPSPLVGMADQLVAQVDEFLAAFAPTADAVPEGERFLDDAARLRDASLTFREEVHRGFDVNRLAYHFQKVDLAWNRLARRIDRISRGRIGPNIARALEIGETARQIHQVLAMPGYPPDLQGIAGR